MSRPNPFELLLRSRKFWLAVFGLVQTVVFQFVPGFPQEVWLAIDGVIVALIGAIAYEDAAVKRSSR